MVEGPGGGELLTSWEAGREGGARMRTHPSRRSHRAPPVFSCELVLDSPMDESNALWLSPATAPLGSTGVFAGIFNPYHISCASFLGQVISSHPRNITQTTFLAGLLMLGLLPQPTLH